MAPQAMENLASLADKVTLDGSHVADMGTFVNNYLDVFNRGSNMLSWLPLLPC